MTLVETNKNMLV